MRSPVDLVRSSLSEHAAARARAARALAHGAPAGDPDRRALARARRALGSGEAREALASAAGLGAIDDAEHGASLDLLARAARDEIHSRHGIEPHRATDAAIVAGEPRTLGSLVLDVVGTLDPDRRARALDALGTALSRDASARREAADEAAAAIAKVRARGPRAPDRAPEDLADRARRFLDATDDAAREAIARAAHGTPFRDPRTLLDALGALRAGVVDPLVPPRDRARRLASSLAPLGLDAPLASRARLDPAHALLDVDAIPIALERRVVIAPSSIELGPISELALARASGRALAILLAAPALPPALRADGSGSIAHALGELLATLHADPLFLRRARGLEGSALDALRRAAGALSLTRARALAARVLLAGTSARERRERGAEGLARALAIPDATMPEGIADPGPLDPDPAADAAPLRAALLGPAIARALRERHDEDWFRNPRAAEPLRAAASRGHALAVETWAAELGATDALALDAIRDTIR